MKKRRRPNVLKKPKDQVTSAGQIIDIGLVAEALVDTEVIVHEDVVTSDMVDTLVTDEDAGGEWVALEEAEPEIDKFMRELIDDVALGLCFEVHREAKIGILFLGEVDEECKKQYALKQARGLDVFGQIPTKKQMDCACPNCGRPMAAFRFAPHLEKCMGMGRNSSRIASRRIASAQKKDGGSDDEDEDDDNNLPKDDEWGGDRKGKKGALPKRDRNGCMLKKLLKFGPKPSKPMDSQSTSSDPGLQLYETMNLDERRHLLSSTCGVISEHTKKMCTKSLRCPQHTDHQRRSVRVFLLTNLPDSSLADDVDVDSIHDDDNDAALSWDRTSSPSPTDSIANSESSVTQTKRKPYRRSCNTKKRRH